MYRIALLTGDSVQRSNHRFGVLGLDIPAFAIFLFLDWEAVSVVHVEHVSDSEGDSSAPLDAETEVVEGRDGQQRGEKVDGVHLISANRV